MDQLQAVEDCAAAVLVGGDSSRMGHNKALLEIRGVPMYLRVARQLAGHFSSILIVGPVPNPFPKLPNFRGWSWVPDLYSRHSVFNGLASALDAAEEEWVALLSCCTPHVCTGLLEHMASMRRDDIDVILPASASGEMHLFHSLWRRSLNRRVAALLRKKEQNKLDGLLDGFRVRVVMKTEWREFDRNARFQAQLDTPEDFDRFMRSLGRKK